MAIHSNLLLLPVLYASFHITDSLHNNACPKLSDYWTWYANKNCFHNPDMTLEPDKLIEKYAGRSETHYVTTDDGYILTVFRMPKENPVGTILLHHPLTSDSRVWIGQGMESLGYILWEAGYDIWIANDRGTPYSQKHESLSVHDYEFWNFSFHDIGMGDIPAQIQLIREKTNNSQIIYIGHSQGCSSAMVYSSLKPEEAQNYIKLFIFMSTPCYYTHGRGLLKAANPIEKQLKWFTTTFKIGHLLPPGILPISKVLFRAFPGAFYILKGVLGALFGYTPEGFDPTVLNLDCGIYLKDFSWKLLLHYVQLSIAKTRFQYYDYGRKQNRKYYNDTKPPRYPLEKMKVPIYFVSSHQDALTSLEDADLLIQEIQNTTKVYGHLKVSGLDHMGFHFGQNRREIYINKLMEFLSTI